MRLLRGLKGTATAVLVALGLGIFSQGAIGQTNQCTVTISGNANSGGSFSGGTFTPSASTANINTSTLQSQLTGNTAVIINTAFAGGTGNGSVTFSASVTANTTNSTQRTFTVNAGGSITVNSGITINVGGTSSNGSTNTTRPGIHVVFNAGSSISVMGGISSNGNVRSAATGGNGGNITLAATTAVAVSGTLSASGSTGGTGFGGGNGGNISITGPTGITISANFTSNGGAGNGTGTNGGNGGTFTFNDGAATVTTGGGINDGQSSGVFAASGGAAGTGGTAGTGGNLVKTGLGTLYIVGTNTYTGSTTITAGAVRAGSSVIASNNGPFGNNAGGLFLNGGTIESATATFSRPVTVSATNSGLDAYGSARTISSAINLATAGTFNLNAGGTFATGGAGQVLTLSGTITNSTGTLGITKTGTSTVKLSGGSNTYSGGVTVSGGQLDINSSTALGTGTLTIGTTATLDNSSGTAVTLSTNNAQAWNADFTFTGSNNLNLGTGTVTLGASRSVTVSAGILTAGGTISSDANSLTKAGAGTLSFGSQGITVNGLTISAGTLVSTSGTLTLKGNLTYSGGTFTHNSGTVKFNGSSAQTISGSVTFNSLEINNTGGVTFSSDITVNGILTLTSENPSSTQGALHTGTATLNMGADATTVNPTPSSGDVTGYVKRTTFVNNVAYSFGSQYTTLTYTSGSATRPSYITCKIDIGAIADWTSWTPNGKVKRVFSFARGSSCTDQVAIKLRFQSSELDGTYNDVSKLTMWHKESGGSPHEHGRTNYDATNYYVSYATLSSDHIAVSTTLTDSQWTLAYSEVTKMTWSGFTSTDWTTGSNWTPPGGTAAHYPGQTGYLSDDVFIPGGLDRYPVIDSVITLKTLQIDDPLNGKTPSVDAAGFSLTVTGTNGAWINKGTFTAGSGTVTFTSGATPTVTTIAGTTDFYNIAVGASTYLQPATGSVLNIYGNITSVGSGAILDFVANAHLVNYKGTAGRTIVNPIGPDTDKGYHDLTISTTAGTVTFPANLDISGDYTNSISGTAAISEGTGSVSFDGTMHGHDQHIYGANTFYDLTIANNHGYSVYSHGNLTVNNTLNIASSSMLDLMTNTLSGTLSTISGTGDLRTQNVSSTPVPAGKSWSFGIAYNGSSAQTVSAGTYSNLTINNSAGATASNDLTVTGVLNLQSDNPSATSGSLALSAGDSLTMGPAATTTGPGDVTGLINRTHTFAQGTAYSFGNAYTTITFTGAASSRPTFITCKAEIGTHPSWLSSAVKRYYSFRGSSATDQVTLRLHFKDSELQAPQTDKSLLVLWDAHGGTPWTSHHPHGKSAYDASNNWVEQTGFSSTYIAPSAMDNKQWGLNYTNSSKNNWLGADLTTNWGVADNWSGGIPGTTSDVLIPAGLSYYSVLTGNVEVKSMEIAAGGTMSPAAYNLTVNGSTNAWTDNGGFVPSTGTVIFSHGNLTEPATLSGTTYFYNLQVNASTKVVPATDAIVNIAGAVTNNGVFDCRTNTNTVEYNGGDQYIVNPNGSTTGYSTLFISGTGSHWLSPTVVETVDLHLHSGLLAIGDGKQMTVTGSLQNDRGLSDLLIESGGSLLHNTAGVPATVQRYIGAWGTGYAGYHFLSSPMVSQAIVPDFVTSTTSTTEDFYAWSESVNVWVNFKHITGEEPVWSTANVLGGVSGGDNFIPGKGYLVEYQNAGTLSFSGLLNNADIDLSGFAISTGYNRGWHLLGNPYPSALTWGTAAWNLTHINATAKIWREDWQSYVDIAQGTGVIPVLNGFMVQVTEGFSGTNSLKIPASARVHDATAWYKEGLPPGVVLRATDLTAFTVQQSAVGFEPGATAGFDPSFDSHFLAGGAAQFYSTGGDQQYSVNYLPVAGGPAEVLFDFIPNEAEQYRISVDTIRGIPGQVILKDLKTGASQDLSVQPAYLFSSVAGDDPHRFLLQFRSTGSNEVAGKDPFHIYVSGNTLYIVTSDGKSYTGEVTLYDLLGRPVAGTCFDGTSVSLTTDSPSGYYICQVTTSQFTSNGKVFLKKR